MKRLSEQEQYEIIKPIFEKIDLSQLSKKVDKCELRLKTNSDNDTEIFIKRNMLKIYSFRISSIGNFYDRWNSKRYTNVESMLKAIEEIVYE